jgi:hypothetical protein
MASGISSKQGDGLRADGLKPANRPRKSWSIVARLAFWYTALSTGVLCGAGVYLALALQRSLDVEVKHLVADKIAVLRQIVRERPTDRDALQEEVAWESSARREAFYYARLLLRDRTIVESPGFKAALPNKVPFPDPAPIDAELPALSEFTTATESHLLLAAAEVASTVERAVPVRSRFDISKQQMLLRSFERKLLVAIALAALVSTGLCTWIARRGIKPLQAIANAARSDAYIVPYNSDYLSLSGFRLFANELRNFRKYLAKHDPRASLAQIKGIIINRYRQRGNVYGDAIDQLEFQLSALRDEGLVDPSASILEPYVRDCTGVSDEHLPVNLFRSHAIGAQDYQALAANFTQVI